MHEIQSIILLDKQSPLSKISTGGKSNEIIIENNLESYILNCAKALASLENSRDKSKISLKFLNREILKSIVDEELSIEQAIEFSIENSIIRIQSIFDRCLILINRVFDLGINNESINYNVIVTNEHIISFGTAEIIKKLKKSFKKYQVERNVVIHHDRFSENDFDNMVLMLSANHLSKQVSGNRFLNDEESERLVNRMILIYENKLQNYLDEIEPLLNKLFDNLTSQYQIKKQLIS